MKLLYWLTAAHVAQAAGRHGRMKKRQEIDGAVNAAKLRLSYITETTTERVTMTQLRTILQTPAAVAPVAAEPVTVTINAEPVTVYETQYVTQVQVETQYVTQVDVQIVTQVAPPLPAVTIKEPITIIQVEPVTVNHVITETVHIPGDAPAPVTITVPGEGPEAITIIHTVQVPQEPSAPAGQVPGPGVTTVPIPSSSLPRTTLASDPYAVVGPIVTMSITPKLPTSVLEPPAAGPSTSPAEQPVQQPAPAPPTSAAEQPVAQPSASTVNEPVAQPSTIATEAPVSQPSATAIEQSTAQPTTTAIEEPTKPSTTAVEEPSAEATSSQAEPTAEPTPTQEESEGGAPTMSPSIELGNMGPDTTGAIAAPALDGTRPTTATAGNGPSQTRAPIDLSDPSKLSSVLDLGNLGGGSGPLKARATGLP
ncbi:unnamed protein product [Fusarium graminearum]|uniref:Uncharacterized protein n=1 Tax=Gibberella zeae TaxID=5518 RepID=A0A2H3GB08_GIBZA|nr:hypothetical protein HG531_012725 [Fusarium graminearum]PCD22953.1 hypothetical protein FGRA07_04323 [Fusarium graminearum]CAF3480242.1 unnamed protein product [Fusarium graminearum]CAF3592798.1 unnamed protein product [Fusarium graminearum]CAG1963073.1 unnamed protein product [Fusarium graminearum]